VTRINAKPLALPTSAIATTLAIAVTTIAPRNEP
jgi:hypothetical protein